MHIWKAPANDYVCFATCSIHTSYDLLDLLTSLWDGGQQVRFRGLERQKVLKGQMTLSETLNQTEST